MKYSANNTSNLDELPTKLKIVKKRTHNAKPDIKRSKPNHRQNG